MHAEKSMTADEQKAVSKLQELKIANGGELPQGQVTNPTGGHVALRCYKSKQDEHPIFTVNTNVAPVRGDVIEVQDGKKLRTYVVGDRIFMTKGFKLIVREI